MSKKVRVRFAPSPTGGLHLGGVRTVLYNYLFARRHGGDFILRIEDTDQGRYVPGAEEYIIESLRWCGLEPDEGPHKGGAYGPYRQSERKARGIYEKYARQLVEHGHAYYAFDTPEELEAMREKYKTADNPSPQYNHTLRKKMRNSLQLDPAETQRLLADGTPYVIRIKLEPDEEVTFTDMIRGEVTFSTTGVDDKVLLKADGMPTYHLAVVVDDHLMEISHAFRGEEWLPSAPVHILLWRYLFGEDKMPQWAHLPLILKPDGNGKLSKRDGDRLGFPVFAMNWTDPRTGEPATGFRETGFLPQAFVNLLALLGWNDGSGQEIFTREELVAKFSMDRVHKGGAKFDFEKAKWFNHEWIKRLPASAYAPQVAALFAEKGIPIPAHDLLRPAETEIPLPPVTPLVPETITDISGAPLLDLAALEAGLIPPPPAPNRFERVLDLVKDRCTLLPEFIPQAAFFFQPPATIDLDAVKPKWNEAKGLFFAEFIQQLELAPNLVAHALEAEFKEMAAAKAIKPGELLMPLRIMLVGGKFGPHVFDIIALIGKDETIRRIRHTIQLLNFTP
ncbi:glutamate--tRNA ligase [Puia dinghuensis]|uniref:Glutamate--tRNA ligase n=1 Tax=Puia dinghuensis TaxID=1792502 RepID=A0A8J2UGN0_9BACT|nr:glutamate--tRNA ligase [Puia dinghuensis]GGB14486.1 glutamate--tRNA ligase [Puia dinghuensis]